MLLRAWSSFDSRAEISVVEMLLQVSQLLPHGIAKKLKGNVNDHGWV